MAKIEEFPPNSVIFKQGDPNQGQLIYIIEGELLVFTSNNSEITPLAIVRDEEFIGEISYFLDRAIRSAHVVTRTQCSLLIIDRQTLTENIPNWLGRTLNSLAKKLQNLDGALNEARIKKRSKKLPDFTMEDQRQLLELVSE